MAFLFSEYTDEHLSKDAAKALIATYGERFATIWQRAWCGWEKQADDFRSRMTPTTRAGIVQNLAVSFAKETFAGDSTVKTCESLGFFKLYIQEKAIVRLKRLRRDYLASNIRTEQQKKYYRQLPMRGITLGLTRITVGYILNLAKTEIEEIAVSFQIDDTLVWDFAIEIEGLGTVATPIPVEPIAPTATPKVRPAVKKKKAGNDE